MEVCGNRMYQLLEKIGFTRMAGTEEELRAAEMIREELASFGLESHLETFTISEGAENPTAVLEVLEPYQKSYPVTAHRCSPETPEEGIEAEFAYIENATEADLIDVKGKVVLANTLRLVTYRKLVKAGAVGAIAMFGELNDRIEETDHPTGLIRPMMLELGALPSVSLRITDAFEMVAKGAKKVRLVVRGETRHPESRNVVACIPGTKYPDQIISFGAHYDSVDFSKGVYDNGAGSVILVEMARYFMENPPMRTLEFAWYGAEEIGLEGSKAYVQAHEEELKDHRFMINVDVAGPVLGADIAKVIGEMSVVHFTDYFMKQRGYNVEVSQGIYSSDSIPFSNKGVPSINFCRFGAPGAAYIHNRHDTMVFLSAESLQKTANFVLDYSESLINAAVFPVEKKMPAEMVEEIDKYLFTKELEEARKEKK